MTLRNIMKLENEIDSFLASRKVSQSTKTNYFYDLKGFHQFFAEKDFNETSLALFQATLKKLSPAAQRRKVSSINQYLLFLYQEGKVTHYCKLERPETVAEKPKNVHPRFKEFPEFYGPMTAPGQFLALLILEFGLNFSEIRNLKWENFDWQFKILTVEKGGMKRILPIREKFAIRVRGITNADELFSKSRQFLYLELKKYTSYSLKELREQYILRQIRSGKTIYELAQLLGLSTIATLEKYYQ